MLDSCGMATVKRRTFPLPKNPQPLDDSPGAAFGPRGLSGPDRNALVGKKQVGTPPPPVVGRRSSLVENYVLREDHETMMKGTLPRPAPQPTIRDKLTEEMKKERYWFGC